MRRVWLILCGALLAPLPSSAQAPDAWSDFLGLCQGEPSDAELETRARARGFSNDQQPLNDPSIPRERAGAAYAARRALQAAAEPLPPGVTRLALVRYGEANTWTLAQSTLRTQVAGQPSPRLEVNCSLYVSPGAAIDMQQVRAWANVPSMPMGKGEQFEWVETGAGHVALHPTTAAGMTALRKAGRMHALYVQADTTHASIALARIDALHASPPPTRPYPPPPQ